MAAAKYRYWLGIKGKGDQGVLPFDEQGFTKEEVLAARIELVKMGNDNKNIVTVITVEDEG